MDRSEIRKQLLQKTLDDNSVKNENFIKELQKLKSSTPEVLDRSLSEGFKKAVGNPRENYLNKLDKVQNAEDWKNKIDAHRNESMLNRGEVERVANYTDKFYDENGKPLPSKPIEPSGTLNYEELKKEYKQLQKKQLAENLVKRVEGLKVNPNTKQTLLEEMSDTAKNIVNPSVKKVAEKGTQLDDFMRKLSKGSKAVGGVAAIPAALMAGSASDAMADAIIPGGVEGVGKGSDMPMQDDTNQIKTYAESATDPNLRRMALQELRNRNR